MFNIPKPKPKPKGFTLKDLKPFAILKGQFLSSMNFDECKKEFLTTK